MSERRPDVRVGTLSTLLPWREEKDLEALTSDPLLPPSHKRADESRFARHLCAL